MKTFIVGVALCALFGASALAQDNPTVHERVQPQVPLKPVFGYERAENVALDRMRLSALDLQNWPTTFGTHERRERMARAERLAALVNLGRCHEAHSVALAESDRAMADRIASVCRGER
jgi:hypothetical protein